VNNSGVPTLPKKSCPSSTAKRREPKLPEPGTVTLPQFLQSRLAAALTATGLPCLEIPQVSATADPRHGDYQSNVAMVLGKKLKQNPRSIATRIVAALDLDGVSSIPSIAGPGFINFNLASQFIAERLVATAADPRLGVAQVSLPKKLVIEFSSPNIAKPMHIGHIRSTLIGDTLARVARFLGHQVITDNHVGDWGTQFGKVIYAWKHALNSETLEIDPIAELVRLYRHADALAKSDPAILEECRVELVKLQKGDPENSQIWKQCVELSEREFAKIYALLGIVFDYQRGESFYNPQLATTVEELLQSGVGEESEGAVVVWDRELSDAPFMVRKTDGGFGYAATDVATVEYRIREWAPDAIWYVVGAPQQLHFQQLFSLAKRLRHRLDLEHVAFGSILGEDRKLMRTRTGESVLLSGVLTEAVSRASTIVGQKNPQLPEEERSEIGRMVGIGAIKYAELSQHRLTDYVFSWDKMLSLHGNTAPYLQNAYVRSRAIFRKLETPYAPPEVIEFREELERALAKKLLQYAEAVPAILDGFKPNVLANYLYELAAQYHAFYESCPVLSAEGVTRQTRLLLCDVFARILQHGLGLLGISVPEKM
jgi:arginyl-tRNA synthetase